VKAKKRFRRIYEIAEIWSTVVWNWIESSRWV